MRQWRDAFEVGHAKATGQGAVFCTVEWAKEKAFELEGSTMSVQGFGNVGSVAAELIEEAGATVIVNGQSVLTPGNSNGLN